jgi:hypothetical protein
MHAFNWVNILSLTAATAYGSRTSAAVCAGYCELEAATHRSRQHQRHTCGCRDNCSTQQHDTQQRGMLSMHTVLAWVYQHPVSHHNVTPQPNDPQFCYCCPAATCTALCCLITIQHVRLAMQGSKTPCKAQKRHASTAKPQSSTAALPSTTYSGWPYGTAISARLALCSTGRSLPASS